MSSAFPRKKCDECEAFPEVLGFGAVGRLDRNQLARKVESGEIDTVLTVFPDLYGRLVGKRITGRFFCEEVIDRGMHACDYLLACDMEMDPVPGYRYASWEKGYGDLLAKPDLTTLRTAAWLDRTAIVLCDAFDHHGEEPVAVAPRTILRRQTEKARAAGLVPKGASELEFYILRDGYERAREKRFTDLELFGWYAEDYHTLQGLKEEPLVGEARRALEASAIPVEFSKGEWSPGQHEINLRYADLLEMADRHVLYKQALKEIAWRQGLSVTFMALLDEAQAGSSMHVHTSLWSADDDRPLFAGGGEPLGDTGESAPAVFRHWLGGQLARAGESALLFAPYPNSSKRYREGTFAPTTIAWSYDNRTCGFRVVGHERSLRVESRIPGADANPYLVFAATIAAGLDGVTRELDPGEPFRGNAYEASSLPQVPRSYPSAIDAFESSAFFREAFGADVVEHLVHFARTEQRKFQEVVTSWERQRYLERA